MEIAREVSGCFYYGRSRKNMRKGYISTVVQPGWTYAVLRNIIRKQTGITSTIHFPEHGLSFKPISKKRREELRKLQATGKHVRVKDYRKHPCQKYAPCF